MALDHFVSQVHLRKFYAPSLSHRKMYVWRKSDRQHFICDARDVCRIPEGSTNKYVEDPRAAEEFLRLVEPRYNQACASALNDDMKFEDVFALAGFTAFVAACSPTAVRLGRSSIAALVESQTRVLDEKGMIDRAPQELGSRSISQLLDERALSVNVDGKFAHAIGISQILELTNGFADTTWEFIRNPFEDSPFLTCDFPVAIAPMRGELALRRFIPFTPELGAYVSPSRAAADSKPSTLNNFKLVIRTAKRPEIHNLNRLIVSCAEDLVFGTIEATWIFRIVERNAELGLVNTTSRKRTQGGYYTFSSLGVGVREK